MRRVKNHLFATVFFQLWVVLLFLCFVNSPVVVADLTVLKNTDGTPLKLVASTYGRGVWQSNLLTQQDVDNGYTGDCIAGSLPQITPSNTNLNPIFVCANDIATTFNNSGTFHLDNVTFSDVDGDNIFISVGSQDDFPGVYNNGISYILNGTPTTVSIDLTLSPTCTNCNIYDYVGVHHITVRAYDFLGATISEKEYTVVILCEGNEYGYTCGGSCPIWTGCPVVGFDPIISMAVVGCNGSTTLGMVEFRATSCPDLVQLTAKLSSSSNPDYNLFEKPQEVLWLAGGNHHVDIYANGALFVPNYPITVPIYNHNAVNFQTLVTNTTAVNAPYCNGVVSVQFIGSTLYNSFQWSNGTAGGNYQSIDHLCAGTYTVTVTDGMGCSATQSATVANATPAVCTCGTNVIGISPNPFTGAVAVTLRLDNTGNCGVNTQEFVTIDLWNTLDVKVATFFTDKLVIGPTHTLNFNGVNLANGLYYLHVKACNTPPLVYPVVKY
ncbi:MAG: hypothetical protein IPN94_21030 [Sphingobacteriales bacterium]|nr:hypothetical protein [Sphingobacteriales bacterium]